jgi:hypothetical protein
MEVWVGVFVAAVEVVGFSINRAPSVDGGAPE